MVAATIVAALLFLATLGPLGFLDDMNPLPQAFVVIFVVLSLIVLVFAGSFLMASAIVDVPFALGLSIVTTVSTLVFIYSFAEEDDEE